MSFNSSDFLIFFPIVVLIYFLIPQKLKNYWLLIASYYFYMCWNAKYALIILFSTIVTYLSGLALDTLQQRSADPLITRKKKIVVAISVLLNLSLLFYFKYINFAIGILGNALSVFHIQLNLPSVDILLPVGISFYTFQALGYTIPEDISIVGFDNIDMCEKIRPKLTTINVNKEIMGKRVVQRLIYRLNHMDALSENTVIGVNLVERETVKVTDLHRS